MPNEQLPISVEFSTEFKRSLRTLAERYRHIQSDLKPLLEQLQSGECPGDQIPDITYPVFKVRVKNSDAQRGKSGGYRVIYYLKTAENIILITIYSKSDQGDISKKIVQQIIEGYSN